MVKKNPLKQFSEYSNKINSLNKNQEGKYRTHLDSLSTSRTLKRKLDYLEYNFSEYLNRFGKDINVLEVGPGKGEFIHYLNSKNVNAIDVLDNDEGIINQLKKTYKLNNAYVSNDIVSFDKKLDSYNVIMLIQVLEHIPTKDHIQVLKTLYSHLKAGGYLFIVVPNANNPLGIVERYGDLQHTTAFTTPSLQELVNYSELNDCETLVKGFEIPPYDLINIFRRFLQKLLHSFLLGIMITNGGVFYRPLTPNVLLIIKKLK